MKYRIGIGYDIHRLVEGRKLILGGVEIPYPLGLSGHSDADVLLHAVCDALFGALGCGDIGEHFPDIEAAYHNISSAELLKKTAVLAGAKGYEISNLDTVIITEEPKLLPFKEQIQANIAKILKLKEDCVNIKAKTNEGLGEIGKKEAIACYAVAMIREGRQE